MSARETLTGDVDRGHFILVPIHLIVSSVSCIKNEEAYSLETTPDRMDIRLRRQPDATSSVHITRERAFLGQNHFAYSPVFSLLSSLSVCFSHSPSLAARISHLAFFFCLWSTLQVPETGSSVAWIFGSRLYSTEQSVPVRAHSGNAGFSVFLCRSVPVSVPICRASYARGRGRQPFM